MIDKKTKIVLCLGIFMFWSTVIPMGESQQSGTLKEPAFTPLEEGEDIFDGYVKDEQTKIDLTQLSFFGHTTVGGIRQESNDSVTKIDLAKTQSIKILQQTYSSERYPEKDFCLIRKKSTEGVEEEFLLPRHVIICGIKKQSGDEVSWYLSKIDELVIERGASTVEIKTPTAKDTNQVDEKMEKKTLEVETQAKSEPMATSPEPTKPIVVKEVYTEKEVKIIDKKQQGEIKNIGAAVYGVFDAIIELIKSILNFIKGLFFRHHGTTIFLILGKPQRKESII